MLLLVSVGVRVSCWRRYCWSRWCVVSAVRRSCYLLCLCRPMYLHVLPLAFAFCTPVRPSVVLRGQAFPAEQPRSGCLPPPPPRQERTGTPACWVSQHAPFDTAVALVLVLVLVKDGLSFVAISVIYVLSYVSSSVGYRFECSDIS